MALTEVKQAGLDDEAVNESKLQISNAGTNGQYLQKQSGNTGGLTWADVPAGVGGATGVDFNDNVKIRSGTGNDLEIFHDGSSSRINNSTGSLKFKTDTKYEFYNSDGTENLAIFTPNGSCELYHDNTKTFETVGDGAKIHGGNLSIYGTEGGYARVQLGADEGDDAADWWQLQSQTDNDFQLGHWNGSSYEDVIVCKPDAAVELYYDNAKKFETTSSGAKVNGTLLGIRGGEGEAATIELVSDEGDDSADNWRITASDDHAFYLQNYAGGGWETNIKAAGNGGVWLNYDNSTKLETKSYGVNMPDNSQLYFGSGDDLVIKHDGTNSFIGNATGDLYIENSNASGSVYITKGSGGQENMAFFNVDGGCGLYHDNVKVLETHANGIYIYGPEGGQASCYFYSDEGDDDADKWRWRNDNAGTMILDAKDSGSWYTHLQVSNSWVNINSRESNQGSTVLKLKKPDAANNVQSTVITFEIDDAGRGQIVAASSGSANPQFSTWSDRRLKTNFRSYTGGYDKIKAIPVKLYDEISTDETKSIIGDNPATNVVGWIADEFQTVFPEAVTGTKDAVDSDGKPIYQSLTQGTIFPDVIQALQAAIAKIETLETKVAALEAA